MLLRTFGWPSTHCMAVYPRGQNFAALMQFKLEQVGLTKFLIYFLSSFCLFDAPFIFYFHPCQLDMIYVLVNIMPQNNFHNEVNIWQLNHSDILPIIMFQNHKCQQILLVPQYNIVLHSPKVLCDRTPNSLLHSGSGRCRASTNLVWPRSPVQFRYSMKIDFQSSKSGTNPSITCVTQLSRHARNSPLTLVPYYNIVKEVNGGSWGIQKNAAYYFEILLVKKFKI